MPYVMLELPPPELKPNRRRGQHWAVTKAVADPYRLGVALDLRKQRQHWQGVPVVWPTPLRIYVFLGKGRRVDGQDVPVWMKEALDEMTGAACWPDDNSSRLDPVTVHVLRDWDNPRLFICWGDDDATLAGETAQTWVKLSKERVTSYRQREG